MDPIAAVRLASTVLAPPACAICGGPATAYDAACGRCRLALAGARSGSLAGPVGRVVWAAPYEDVARELVVSLKFAGRLPLARVAADAIAEALAARAPEILASPQPAAAPEPVIVPVPPAPFRLRRRGFDPAELIAVALGKRLALEVLPCLARRGGRRQVGRGRAARLADPPRIISTTAAPARALVVDDVFTTGATIAACAGALRAEGCEDVAAAVFARTGGRLVGRPAAGNIRLLGHSEERSRS